MILFETWKGSNAFTFVHCKTDDCFQLWYWKLYDFREYHNIVYIYIISVPLINVDDPDDGTLQYMIGMHVFQKLFFEIIPKQSSCVACKYCIWVSIHLDTVFIIIGFRWGSEDVSFLSKSAILLVFQSRERCVITLLINKWNIFQVHLLNVITLLTIVCICIYNDKSILIQWCRLFLLFVLFLILPTDYILDLVRRTNWLTAYTLRAQWWYLALKYLVYQSSIPKMTRSI